MTVWTVWIIHFLRGSPGHLLHVELGSRLPVAENSGPLRQYPFLDMVEPKRGRADHSKWDFVLKSGGSKTLTSSSPWEEKCLRWSQVAVEGAPVRKAWKIGTQNVMTAIPWLIELLIGLKKSEDTAILLLSPRYWWLSPMGVHFRVQKTLATHVEHHEWSKHMDPRKTWRASPSRCLVSSVTQSHLLGGWPTPLKNMSQFKSVGMMTFPRYGKIIHSCSSHHQPVIRFHLRLS